MFLPMLVQCSVRVDERPNTLNMRKVFFMFVSAFLIFITFDKEETEKHR